MKEITCWYVWNKNKKDFEFNHIDTKGYSQSDYPLILDKSFKNQINWKNHKWKKVFGYLTNNNNKVIENTEIIK